MKLLKKTKAIVMLVVVIFWVSLALISCSKDSAAYTCATCHSTPEALAANDASAKGIYKGTEVGSSGTLSINIQNGSSTITGTMVLDGVSVALTSSVAYVDGQAYVAPFTGVFRNAEINSGFPQAVCVRRRAASPFERVWNMKYATRYIPVALAVLLLTCQASLRAEEGEKKRISYELLGE